MLNRALLVQLTRLVLRSERILVVSHANCGDATGSVTALYLALTRLGKQVTVFLPAPVPKSFRFLPRTEIIKTDPAVIKWSDFDLFLCVDAAEPKLTGLESRWSERPASLTTVNFDHHHTNTGYGDLNLIDKESSAACAMLYEWWQSSGWFIDRQIATCLLTGILTDTGSFSNPGTNEVALRTASSLILQGASMGRVLDQVVRNRTLVELKLWGRALERLQENAKLGLVTTIITQADIAELGATAEALEGVANFLNELQGPRAIMVLKEQSDGTVKGSLRTTRDDIDVAALAALFGGGGHRKAAGFTVPGRLVETEQGWRVEE
ncbi:MAG: bifunctional oligoribonuclease/PAP phosphatase NrnA [Candidatus Kerfeldbacteria bacterium]|nr:bifunctional oligoribonuclease/PAP phosphatase NrnA [Candidatus Kerfeldbacteria bacterium]